MNRFWESPANPAVQIMLSNGDFGGIACSGTLELILRLMSQNRHFSKQSVNLEILVSISPKNNPMMAFNTMSTMKKWSQI
jgi:hypothetical protein